MATKKKNSKPSKKSATVEKYDPTVLNITVDDVEECCKFFDFFKIQMDPTLKAIRDKLNAGGVFTLQDQADIRKILAGDISKGSHRVWHDEIFKDIRVEVAEVLLEIVKEECK